MTAVLLALARLAQIDQRDVGPADQRHRLRRAAPPSRAARSPPAPGPTCMLAGTATSIIFGLGRLRLFISVDVLVDRLHLQARIEALLLADGGDGVALVVVRREDQRLVRQLQQLVEDRIRTARAASPFWKSVRPVPRISSVSPVNTRSRIRKL